MSKDVAVFSCFKRFFSLLCSLYFFIFYFGRFTDQIDDRACLVLALHPNTKWFENAIYFFVKGVYILELPKVAIVKKALPDISRTNTISDSR